MKWDCIIVEDEFPARRLMANYVNQTPELVLLGEFRDPTAALEFLQNQKADIIFLDIQMPTLSGIEFIKQMPRPAAVILTTAYQDFALQGFELQVVDYLLKPFSFERFAQANKRALDQLNAGLIFTKDRNIKSGTEYHRIKLDDIKYVEGMREYVRYHTSGNTLMELISLKALETELPFPAFKRIHKSYIVNRTHINQFDSSNITIDNNSLPIGKTYRNEVQEWLANW